MPYIPKADREKLDPAIREAVKVLCVNQNPGELNYFLSTLILRLFERKKKYQTINDIIGALEGVKLEFYRRQAAPYEDEKIKTNGDIS